MPSKQKKNVSPKKKKTSFKKKSRAPSTSGKKKNFRLFFLALKTAINQKNHSPSPHRPPCPSGAEQSLHPDVLKDHHPRHGVVVVLHDPCFATPGAMDGWLAGYDGMGMMREICFFFCENGHKLVPGFRFL